MRSPKLLATAMVAAVALFGAACETEAGTGGTGDTGGTGTELETSTEG